MSNKDLQRLTKCVSYIGQPVSRPRALSNHRSHVAQKVNVTSHCSLYISVHDDEHSAESLFLPKGSDCSSEFIDPHVVLARLMSLALQYGAPLEKVGDLLTGAQFTPCGPVSGHDHLKSCTSLPDLIGRHLLVEYCGRHELGHSKPTRPIGEGEHA